MVKVIKCWDGLHSPPAQACGGVTIPGNAQKCVDMDDGGCGGGAGLIFGHSDLKGLFEF